MAAGSLDTGNGRMTLKVPGVIENIEDVMSMPIKVDGDTVVTFGDVAMLQRTFKDPRGFARINGETAVVLEVSKRTGANIIETVEQVRELIAQAQPHLPDTLDIRYIMDQSEEVRDMLSDLLNNVLTAIVLVLIVIIAAMGLRSALLVGLTIPGAFLAGILVIWLMGFTLNIVVLFSLILVAGMLVDGAIACQSWQTVTCLTGKRWKRSLGRSCKPYGLADHCVYSRPRWRCLCPCCSGPEWWASS